MPHKSALKKISGMEKEERGGGGCPIDVEEGRKGTMDEEDPNEQFPAHPFYFHSLSLLNPSISLPAKHNAQKSAFRLL